LDNEVFDIIDARCKYEDHFNDTRSGKQTNRKNTGNVGVGIT